MKIIQINPYDKKIEIANLEDIDNNFSKNLEKEAKEVEEGIKIVAHPIIGEERNGIFLLCYARRKVREYIYF
jgi:hypothetical protein